MRLDRRSAPRGQKRVERTRAETPRSNYASEGTRRRPWRFALTATRARGSAGYGTTAHEAHEAVAPQAPTMPGWWALMQEPPT